MKINVFTKDIIVEPKICKDSKDKFKIILRYPNQFESTALILNTNHSQILKTACDLFVKFENKPILENEDGKEIKYETLSDMMEFGGNQLLTVINDVVKALNDAILEAGKVEKKP